ncbi:MAG: signal peptidase I [Rhodothalassiaceae bacterium]
MTLRYEAGLMAAHDAEDNRMIDSDSEKQAGEDTPVERSFAAWLVETVKIVIAALLIALGLRTVLFEPFNIPSESMLPTLMVGDYLFVSKYPYGWSRHSIILSPPLFKGRIFEGIPKRGDVVVFKLPRDGKSDYIKRVIGLPGDRIQMVEGVLFINGQPVRKERVADFVAEVSPNTGCGAPFLTFDAEGKAFCRYPQYRETLPDGRSYMTLDLMPAGPMDNTRVYVVPEGHYFLMGDNRDNSLDSRRPASTGVGYVPAENLVGRAEILFFSTDGGARLWQPWRWFQSIRYSRIFNDL